MKIREAKPEDLEDIYALWFELMDYHNGHSIFFDLEKGYEKLIKGELSVRLNQADTKIFLCKENGAIAGMIIASLKKTSGAFRYHQKGYIAETVVSKKFRGRGVGRELFDKAKEWLKRKGADHIELQVSVKNERALQFWKNRGFDTVTQHMILDIKDK